MKYVLNIKIIKMKTQIKIFLTLIIVMVGVLSTSSFSILHSENCMKSNTKEQCTCKTCNGSGSCGYCNGGSYTCAVCNGSGTKNDETCGGCNGTGKIPCRACNETGRCISCSGTGKIECNP